MSSETSESQRLEDTRRAIALEDYRSNTAETAERLRFQVEYAHAALKNLHLTNGAAILALLTFLGNTGVEFSYRAIWWAFFWFGCGLVSSLSAYFGAYFSQAEFMNVTVMEAWNAQKRARGLEATHDFQAAFRRGNCFMYFGIVTATASLVFFIVGAFVALSALK